MKDAVKLGRHTLDAVFARGRSKHREGRGSLRACKDLYEALRWESTNPYKTAGNWDAGKSLRRWHRDPLIRWLKSHLGQSWNVIYGAVCAAPYKSKEERQTVLKMVEWTVLPSLDEVTAIYGAHLYVNEEGTLCLFQGKSNHDYSWRRPKNKPLKTSEGEFVIWHNGVFYATTTDFRVGGAWSSLGYSWGVTPLTRPAHSCAKNGVFYADKTFGCDKRQLSTRELKALGLKK